MAAIEPAAVAAGVSPEEDADPGGAGAAGEGGKGARAEAPAARAAAVAGAGGDDAEDPTSDRSAVGAAGVAPPGTAAPAFVIWGTGAAASPGFAPGMSVELARAACPSAPAG